MPDRDPKKRPTINIAPLTQKQKDMISNWWKTEGHAKPTIKTIQNFFIYVLYTVGVKFDDITPLVCLSRQTISDRYHQVEEKTRLLGDDHPDPHPPHARRLKLDQVNTVFTGKPRVGHDKHARTIQDFKQLVSQFHSPTFIQLRQQLHWVKSDSRLYQLCREAKISFLIPASAPNPVPDAVLAEERVLHALQFISAWQEFNAGRVYILCQDETGLWSNCCHPHRHLAPTGSRATCNCDHNVKPFKINLSIFVSPVGIAYVKHRTENYNSTFIIEDCADLMAQLKGLRADLEGYDHCEVFWDAATFHWSDAVVTHLNQINHGVDQLDPDDADDQELRWDLHEDDVIPFHTTFRSFPRGSPATNLCENVNQMIKAAVCRIKQRGCEITTMAQWSAIVDDALREVNTTLVNGNKLYLDKVAFAMATCLSNGDYDKALKLQKKGQDLEQSFNEWFVHHGAAL